MVVISFRNRTDWYKPNWVFRQLVDDITALIPTDDDLKLKLEQAEAFGALFLDSLTNEAEARLLLAMKGVAETAVQGKTLGWKSIKPEDERGQRLYVEAMQELLRLLNNELGE
jgi:hypothetical protein